MLMFSYTCGERGASDIRAGLLRNVRAGSVLYANGAKAWSAAAAKYSTLPNA